MDESAERLLIVSSDGHVGPPSERYREYVDPVLRGEFDQWFANYVPIWLATRSKDKNLPVTWSEEYKRQWLDDNQVPWGVEGKWDARRRLEALDTDGIAVDVVFPDDQSANSPPFVGLARDFNRRWDNEYSPQLKLAGARAYNRWLADFCSEDPKRLLGVALMGSLADVDGVIEEVKHAKQLGLAGVLLPVFYYNIAEAFWHDQRYDPLWATCAELDMPVHTHVGPGSPYYGDDPVAPVLYGLESTYWVHRPLWFMVLGGVLERYPRLKLVFTEQPPITWVLEAMARMDGSVANRTFSFGEGNYLKLKPSEYFERQVWLGATLVTRPELEMRYQIGVKKIIWGSDYPHLESQWPHTKEKLRDLMKGIPGEEVRAMVGGNAVEPYALDPGTLAPIVERVGPLVDEIVTP